MDKERKKIIKGKEKVIRKIEELKGIWERVRLEMKQMNWKKVRRFKIGDSMQEKLKEKGYNRRREKGETEKEIEDKEGKTEQNGNRVREKR